LRVVRRDDQDVVVTHRPSFGKPIGPVHTQWGSERDLKFDLLPTERTRSRQRRDLVECAPYQLGCFNEGRAFERALPCFAPQVSGFFNLPGLGPVTRQQFGLVFGNLSELALKGMRDASMKRASRLA
jgi:hypothetical protein